MANTTQFYRNFTAALTGRITSIAQSGTYVSKQVIDFAQSSPIPRSFAMGYLGFAVFILPILLSLFLLVKVRTQSYELGYQVMQLQKQKKQLQEQLRSLRTDRTRLTSPGSLLQLNSSMGLYLLSPREWWPSK